jgi:hypothetical protein
LARTPHPRGESVPGARCWRVKPLVIAAVLNGAETRMLSEAGQAPLVAWDDGRIGRIVDMLLREILLLRYNEERAYALLKSDDQNTGRHAINCIPDLYAAMEISRACNGALKELLIPPPGLPRSDRELLGRLLSVGDEPVAITTFDDAELSRP